MVNFHSIEKKWQKIWETKKAFKTKETQNKYYVLEMFPYPSGYGIHMGHAENYSIGDVYARFKRMQGFNVLYPMGYDSFGLPAENAAIKNKKHPKIFTETSIKNIIKQQKAMGLSYDWERLISTYQEDYYKWNQFLFLEFFKKGLAYRKKAPVNWCPKCNTVLANEQVINGCCWRHEDTQVEVKQLEQWFLKITDYANELLDLIDTLDWPERIKTMQKNWIGRSTGTLIEFPVKGSKEKIPVFTTRIDTIYGVTFMVIAPEHPIVMELVKNTKHEEKVKKFINKVVLEDKFERTAEDKEKEGLFIGKHAINPLTKEEIPIYIANFVVSDYGTGAVMAVPAHDQRDFEFAKKYNIPIKIVIHPKNQNLKPEKLEKAYIEDGILVNSEKFNDLNNREAISKINDYIARQKMGKETVQFKLRDWLVSRQRYWGTPIPIIYCDKCGIQPEENLPVKLPTDVKFGKDNPIKSSKKFQNVKCPKCKGKARRETDTMDTFFDSSWYFLRFCDPKNKKEPFDKKKVDYWMPVNQYIGGAEHAVMHLLYARFFTKVLRDLKYLKFDEPFTSLINQGTVTKDGKRMAKSLGNVVDPMDMINKYSADTLRFYILFVSAPESDIEWDDTGIESVHKSLTRIYDFISSAKFSQKSNPYFDNKIHRTIKDCTILMENIELNKILIKIMDYFNYIQKENCPKQAAETLLLLLAPFTPHLCEELWSKRGKKKLISLESWPKYDEKKIDDKIEASELLVETTIKDIRNILKLIKFEPKRIVIYCIPKEKEIYNENSKQIERALPNLEIDIYAVNDKDKYDPENKSKKCKPGKPAIYLE